MFVKLKTKGYTARGEQFARGRFLALFSHNPRKAEEQANLPVYGPPHWNGRPPEGCCSCAGEPSYCQKYCPVHAVEYIRPNLDERKLYAYVGKCSLTQCGHFMMGTLRIGNEYITVSGTYGADGLPRDYESLSSKARAKLVELPHEIAAQYWSREGSDIGEEGPLLRDWALRTFK